MRMMYHNFIVLVVLVLASTCCAHIGGHISYQDISPQVYCGRKLARALAAICYEFNGPEKRSDPGTMYGAILTPYKDQEGSYGWPWLAPQNARSLSLPSRGKRFVVNECCDKACSISELWSYC